MGPWEYLFKGFSTENFESLWNPTWQLSALMIIVSVIFYNVQSRRLRNHRPYEDLNESLLWASVGVYGVLIALTVFKWDFLFVLPTMIAGAFLFIWLRFVHYPPLLEAYQQRLSRQKYFQRSRTAHPEATIRSKPVAAKRKRR